MNSDDTTDAPQRIRREIELLRQQLDDALKNATYFGMTAAEAKTYDERRQRLTALVERLRECKTSAEEPEPIA